MIRVAELRVFRLKRGRSLVAECYDLMIAVIAALCAIWLGPREGASITDWTGVGVFSLLSVIAELFPVTLPASTGKISVGLAVNLAAILLFGPIGGGIVASLGVLVAGLFRNLYLTYIVFNVADMFLTAVVAGVVYRQFHGSLVDATSHVVLGAVLLTLLTYFLVNSITVTASVSLEERMPFFRTWAVNVRWVILNYFVLGALGLFAAVSYRGPLGVLGVAILFIPLFLARYGFQKYMEVRQAHLEMVQALAAALDAKDRYTRGHSDRVADLCVRIGRRMQLSEDVLDRLYRAALLHDVGKIGIMDHILHKPGSLDPEEYELVKTHAAAGAEIVGQASQFADIAKVIRHHHEWWDGRGYPDRLHGTDIPIESRIISVADAWDAMTTDRAYRKGLSPEDALRRLQQGSGSQFDPTVVDVVRDLFMRGEL